jgi:hypothetical protein
MRASVRGAVLVVLAGAPACNGGLEPVPVCGTGFVGVCGTVSFAGQLPESTSRIFIVAFDTFPKSQSDLFKFKPLTPPTLPLGGPPYFYTLPLPPGRYEWVLAVWQKQSEDPLTTTNADSLLRETGFYRDQSDPMKPGVVTVSSGTATASIDFAVDFGNMHRVCEYFPPCPP